MDIKNLIQEKNIKYRSHISTKQYPQIFDGVKNLPNQRKYLIEENKENYYSRKSRQFMDPITSAETYCSTLKRY